MVNLLFPNALQLERDLGINFWDDEFPGCDRFHLLNMVINALMSHRCKGYWMNFGIMLSTPKP
ncbi:hypothetical protein [Fischerella thermalis]|uniref:hypothetical protein n=1 Tax=Fischerella thermalis TaxID=372787 RepID=UPI0015E0A46C|nr:hypothetical protein [Fischerella thermalis]